jgi:hypothetical protein
MIPNNNELKKFFVEISNDHGANSTLGFKAECGLECLAAGDLDMAQFWANNIKAIIGQRESYLNSRM